MIWLSADSCVSEEVNKLHCMYLSNIMLYTITIYYEICSLLLLIIVSACSGVAYIPAGMDTGQPLVHYKYYN